MLKIITLLLICLPITQIISASNETLTKPNLTSTTAVTKINQTPNKYHGAGNISLNFQQLPIKTALQVIAQFAKINIIVNEHVKGKLTLHLQDMSWQQALSVILKTQDLVQHKIGHIIVISSTDEFITQQKKQFQAMREGENLSPLKSKAFRIKYGKAKNYYDTLKNANNALLSKQGTMILNQRTNTLFIIDTATKLTAIQHYLAKTDIPVQQIEIAARIVTIDRSFEQQIGIKWNIQATSTTSPTGKTHPNGFKLDFGAASIGTTPPARIAMATLTNNILIGLELSALEAEGGGEILSNPRLITADQQEAVIEQGTEIPYNEATNSGAAAIAFKKALLRLKVTPQITPSNKILLHLDVNQDAKSTDTSAGDTPLIDTRHISTHVLVNNGETVVLGGIYERTKSQRITRIPFFSAIPLVGRLFKQQGIKDTRKELLIFVTPRIINSSLNTQVKTNGRP